MMYCLPNISSLYRETMFPRMLPVLLPLIHITLTGSVYTTIAVACERCITVLAPFTQVKVRTMAIRDYVKLFFKNNIGI